MRYLIVVFLTVGAYFHFIASPPEDFTSGEGYICYFLLCIMSQLYLILYNIEQKRREKTA